MMESKVEIYKIEQSGGIKGGNGTMNDSTNMNVIIIDGVECYELDGTVYLKLEAVARGLGFTREKNGIEYIRWDRVEDYLKELGFPTCGENGFPDYIPENIFYRLAMKAKNETAEAFQAKVADEIIPTIRKTGGYVANDDLFVETYFGNMSEEQKQICRMSLAAIREKDQIIEKQKLELVEKDKAIEHKEDVIIGLVNDIDLATKRQRINQIVRYHVKDSATMSKRWNLLYSEFEKKYHVNLSVRLENYMDAYKPKLKNKIDVIERQMKMIPQLYEICCKLFENDVKILMEEWESTIVA